MIDITTDTSAFNDSLRELQKRMGDLRPVYRSLGAELETRILSRFETRSDPAGKAWEPWSEQTIEHYPADGRRKLLERYGDMLSSLNWKASADMVRVGFGAVASRNRDVYATYHEFGAPNNNMPRRGLLYADPEKGQLGAADEQAIDDVLQDWLDGVFD
jgi:phage virion morphogenesis protein